jgi:hypothetical protein
MHEPLPTWPVDQDIFAVQVMLPRIYPLLR